jgi:hypothetical protein
MIPKFTGKSTAGLNESWLVVLTRLSQVLLNCVQFGAVGAAMGILALAAAAIRLSAGFQGSF